MSPENNDQNLVIRATNVNKRFQLGQFISLASSLKNIKRIISNPIDFFSNKKETPLQGRFEEKNGKTYLWALRNVNFELYRGEKVAILGRNGAGKSTLLKILVGIMSPTSGTISTNARIVPLMGVGAGFNPELSGRENVFLYGGILGVPPAEIKEKYQDIIKFADIDQFMETPLKRYSKGMRARLGMAVALNLKPDVLVVDEVLAVGDVKFRAKCMDAMKEMCDSGMTLLFVSHSPARVKTLCERSILMRDGELIDDGDTSRVLERYLREDGLGTPNPDAEEDDPTPEKKHHYLGCVTWEIENAPGDEIVQIVMARICDELGNTKQDMDINKPIILEMEYIVHEERILRPQFQLLNQKMEPLFITIDSSGHWRGTARQPGMYRSRAVIPANTLGIETFIVGASVYSHTPLEKHARTGEIISFTTKETKDISSAQSDYPRPLPGFYRPLLEWNTEELVHTEEHLNSMKIA